MAMKDIVEEFLNYLVVERGLSDNTISAYRSDLYKYTDSLESNKKRLHLNDVTRNDVRDYMIYQKDKALSSNSISRRLVA
ncbi:MAG: site-specific integrase, partial [Candidatus Omnitrophota bacterium]